MCQKFPGDLLTSYICMFQSLTVRALCIRDTLPRLAFVKDKNKSINLKSGNIGSNEQSGSIHPVRMLVCPSPNLEEKARKGKEQRMGCS